jgi:hypothetical protein
MSLLLHDGRIMSHCVSSEAQLKEMMENEAGSVAPMVGLGLLFAVLWRDGSHSIGWCLMVF